MNGAHRLFCHVTGESIEDDGTIVCNSEIDTPSLLTTDYGAVPFSPCNHSNGIYRYDFWLPSVRRLAGSSAPVSYKSKSLAEYLGLSQLYVTFSGYWPERGVRMLTGTFKECEAYAVCARVPEGVGTLVVASAGNTARAFARVCSENSQSLVVVIPQRNLDALWLPARLNSCVRVVAIGEDGDYSDAIHVARRIASLPGFLAEGGAGNVARRDGMGTTVLSAVETIGRIPDYYFQAIGSGTGAIAAYEANERLIRDGRFGSHYMKLRLSQNAPFQPIYDSWKAGTRELLQYDEAEAKRRIGQLHASVLANRTPPYAITGGVFDVLSQASGDVLLCDRQEAREAGELFAKLEGVVPSPAASVAIASLIQQVKERAVERDACIMLNVTGGGFDRVAQDYDLVSVEPDVVISAEEPLAEDVVGRLRVADRPAMV